MRVVVEIDLRGAGLVKPLFCGADASVVFDGDAEFSEEGFRLSAVFGREVWAEAGAAGDEGGAFRTAGFLAKGEVVGVVEVCSKLACDFDARAAAAADDDGFCLSGLRVKLVQGVDCICVRTMEGEEIALC